MPYSSNHPTGRRTACRLFHGMKQVSFNIDLPGVQTRVANLAFLRYSQ
jgi:hypothetical protein